MPTSQNPDTSTRTEETAETVTVGGAPERRRALHRGVCVGRYVVLDRVGEGGMGVVYKAYDPELERAVALKFLHAETREESSGSTRRDRLLREAKALARLSHPNVVSVFDVGTHGTDVFIATEFLEGQTLRQWLQETPRPRAEILRAFLAAGEGLAAAHRADLVHRDFKPGNVIVGKDGRVRVLDFGLARAGSSDDSRTRASMAPPSITSQDDVETVGPGPGSTATPRDPLAESAPTNLLSSPLTEVGQIIGTPRYMAPEQQLGQPTDARCDQFAFCVALYEALYGQLPFEGGGEDYRRNVTQGNVRPPPEKARVPRALRQILLRGLATAPAARYPSMDALLAALAKDGAATRRRWLAAGSLVVIAALSLTGWARARREATPVCGGAERKLTGVWDGARREAVRGAFAATHAPWAADASRNVERVLDDYAGAWAAMHEDACEATRVRGEQSEELLDLRMQCLEERRQELRAQVDLLVRGEPEAMESAARAARGLPRLDECADIAALRAPVPPPKGAEARARVEALEARLAEARALQRAGSYREGTAAAREVADGATALGYRPLEADALFLLGDLQDDGGAYKDAEATLVRAAQAALAGRSERTAARALTSLVIVVGLRDARYDEAHAWDLVAEGEAERTGDAFVRGEVARNLGRLLYQEQRYEASREAIDRAIALWTNALGPDDLSVAGALTDLGNVYFAEEKNDEAASVYRRSLAILEKAFGEEHPYLAPDLNNLAGVQERQGDLKGAIASMRRALALWEAALGPDHQKVGVARYNLGQELLHEGDVDHALVEAERALAILENALAKEHPLVAMATIGLAEVVRAKGDLARARALFEKGLALEQSASEPDDEEIGEATCGLGELDLAEHQPKRAAARLAQGVALLEKDGSAEPYDVGDAELALARALRASGADGVSTREIASRARAAFVKAGKRGEPRVDEIDRWLATLGPSPASPAPDRLP